MDASWADAIQRYGREKRVVPELQDVLPKRLYRDARTGQKDKEREYDPLGHVWRDSHKEQRECDREAAAERAEMQVAKDRAMRYESHYDVITNARKIDAPKTPPAKPMYEPEPEPEKKEKGKGLSHYYWPSGDKDFHIISNRYLSDHDAKTKADHQRALEESAHCFGRQNHYNIIQGKLFHPADEERYQRARRQAESTWGMSKQLKLPLAIKTSEGVLYDIVAPHVVRDRKHLAKLEQQDFLKRQDNGLLRQKFERSIEALDDAHARAPVRALNRISHQRHSDTADRGYNIITGVDFKGRGGAPLAPPQTRPQRATEVRVGVPFDRTLRNKRL